MTADVSFERFFNDELQCVSGGTNHIHTVPVLSSAPANGKLLEREGRDHEKSSISEFVGGMRRLRVIKLPWHRGTAALSPIAGWREFTVNAVAARCSLILTPVADEEGTA